MRKKTTSRKTTRVSKKSDHKVIGLSIIIVGCLMLFVVAIATYRFTQESQVLGTSTILAEDANTSTVGSNDSTSEDSGTGNTSTGFVHPNGFFKLGPQPSGTQDQNENEQHRPPTISGKPQNPHFGFGNFEDGSHSSSFKNRGRRKHGRVQFNGDLLISSNSGKFRLKTGTIEAETHFPLSIDPTTNQVTVTTPHGTKTVAVLPDEAVQALVEKGIISNINQSSSSSQINLTENNNQPVFSINGVSDKKFLGIVPDSIQKTVDVSTQNGQVVSVNENFLQRLLDLFSF